MLIVDQLQKSVPHIPFHQDLKGMMVKEVTQEKKARMAKWDARDQRSERRAG